MRAPFRWSADVSVLPTLEPAKNGSAGTDGGCPSGHAAEGWRDGLTMAYRVPDWFQEMVARAVKPGDSRIIAGLHAPLDVIGGPHVGHGCVVDTLNRPDNADLKHKTYQQASAWLMRKTGALSLIDLEHQADGTTAPDDRFADRHANAASVAPRLTYGFAPIGPVERQALVPKGAEIVLETRLPYLTPTSAVWSSGAPPSPPDIRAWTMPKAMAD